MSEVTGVYKPTMYPYDQSWNPSDYPRYNPVKDGEIDQMALRRFVANAFYRGHPVEHPEYQWDLGDPWGGSGYSYDPANPANELDFEPVSYDPRNPYNMPLEYDEDGFVSNEEEFNPALGLIGMVNPNEIEGK